jgi:dihydrofolate reductase/thymidylate synthase
MKPFSIVVAADSKFGIGKDGGLPWNLPSDLKHFKKVTTANAAINTVIMGRKTWDSLPLKYRPLPGRLNIVISRQQDLALPAGVKYAKSLEHALGLVNDEAGEIFVIGGGQIFTEAMASPLCQRLYLTHVENDFSCDTFLPKIPGQFIEEKRDGPYVDAGVTLYFCEYGRKHA